VWVFLSGGILDRLARARPVEASHFFSACGGYAIRFLRLAALVGAVYWILFRWVHPYLFGSLYHRLTHDMTEERDAMVVRGLLYALFIVAVVNVSPTLRKSAVVEDRRSAAALGASLRFIRRASACRVYSQRRRLLSSCACGSLAPGAGARSGSAAGRDFLLARVGQTGVRGPKSSSRASCRLAPTAAAPDRQPGLHSPAVEVMDNRTRL
jgi:hypothetical protein